MSEHHTRIETSQLIAEVEELERLKRGNIEEVENARKRMLQSLELQKQAFRQIQKQLSAERRKNLQLIHTATDSMLREAEVADTNAEIAQRNMRHLNDAVLSASQEIDAIVQRAKENTQLAEQLYIEMATEFTKTESLVSYRRFAGDLQSSLRDRFSQLSTREVSGSAMQIMATSVVTDIYRMDISVAREQALFDASWNDAVRLLESVYSQCRSAEKENYAEVGNPETELLDINYWSEGRFSILIDELESLRTKLIEGYRDATYTTAKLKKDLARLHELDKMKDIVIAEQRLAYNQSCMRENQALAAMDILMEEHQFTEVGKGFEGNDRREAFILRMRRHTDNAEIEVIGSPTAEIGSYNLYLRLDSKSYSDQSIVKSITEALANDFKEAGLKIDVNPHCTAEYLEPFDSENPTIPEAARILHNIPLPQSQASN